MTHSVPPLATRLEAAGRIAVAEQPPLGPIPPGHVRLRLAAASLCGTDLHYFRHFANAGFALRNPVTLGHEACGHVEDPNGSALRAGQLVALNPIMNCGTCEACRRGEENLCTAKKFPGSATTVPHLDGFFRTFIDHPAERCRPVAEGVAPRQLTFAEPFACALHALDKGAVAADMEVLVTGCGPMGLLAVVGAVARGARVTALDLREGAVALARRVGAAEGLVAGQFDPAALDNRFDVVVEASGAIPAFNTALAAVRRKGRVAILSNIQPAAAEVALHRIMLREIEVIGSFQFNREFEQAVRLIESGAVDLEPLIGASWPLSRLGEALAAMAAGEVNGKIVITPEEG